MIFDEKILEQIVALGEKDLTIEEIANKLHFKTKLEKKELAKAVKKMIRSGSIVDKGKGKFAPSLRKNLLKGELKGNRRGFAFLIREDKGEDIFIPNKSLNSALHGDTVYVKLVGESEGVVINIAKRGIQSLVGTYTISDNYGFVIPDDNCYFKDIYIPRENTNGAKPLSKVVVSIAMDKKNNKPYGTITEVLGQTGERRAEVLSILLNYGFKECFPEEVLKAAEKIVYEHTERKDMRNIVTITIDGEDAKDFDDAISLETTDTGYKLYVHIADVSHYVKGGGIIDKEALNRTTSVYFPGSVFPMLPETISNGVCSLRPGEDKLTLTVVMNIDNKGNVTNSKFYETLSCSDFRMTYTEVTKILNGDEEMRKKYDKIVPMLENAEKLAAIITKKRNDNGSINFVSTESKIVLDDNGDVADITPYPYDKSNNIIEQFMVTTNETVAEFIEKKKVPCVYRVHEEINPAKLESFMQFLKGQGYSLDMRKGVSPKLFSDLLEEIKGSPSEQVINKIMLRSMQKAKYTTTNSGHFGLSLDYYCHFTSPIRRYPDLMVHRVLKAIINDRADENFVSRFKNYCDEAATRSSEREIAAERAERDIDDYYKALYMTKFVGERYLGIVSGVVGAGIFVSLENTVEGFISMDDLPADRYEVDEKNYRIVGTKYSFMMSDKVEIEIKSSNVETRSINMLLVSNAENHLKKRIKNA